MGWGGGVWGAAVQQYHPVAENEVAELWQPDSPGCLRTASPHADDPASDSAGHLEGAAGQQCATSSQTVPPLPLAPAGFVIGQVGVAEVGSQILYLWPEDGWQRGKVDRPSRVAPFSHVVRYRRATSALHGEVDTLLDECSYGSRWVLLAPDTLTSPTAAGCRQDYPTQPNNAEGHCGSFAKGERPSAAAVRSGNQLPSLVSERANESLSFNTLLPQKNHSKMVGTGEGAVEGVVGQVCLKSLRLIRKDLGTSTSGNRETLVASIRALTAKAKARSSKSQVRRLASARDSGGSCCGACGESPVPADPAKLSALVTVPQEWPCDGCGRPDREDEMVLCDACDGGWHLDCLSPALTTIPVGEWFCPACAVSHLPRAANSGSGQNCQVQSAGRCNA